MYVDGELGVVRARHENVDHDSCTAPFIRIRTNFVEQLAEVRVGMVFVTKSPCGVVGDGP